MIETDRLLLRRWRADDAAPFFAMGQDVDVMRYLGPLMDREACITGIARQNELAAHQGSCFWAIERRDSGAFIGFCGIKNGPAGTPIADRPEIGWRLARDQWGQGLAREAAEACLADAWIRGVDRVHAITVPANRASWGLMLRLGMVLVGTFDHPALLPGDPLRQHVHYCLDRPHER